MPRGENKRRAAKTLAFQASSIGCREGYNRSAGKACRRRYICNARCSTPLLQKLPRSDNALGIYQPDDIRSAQAGTNSNTCERSQHVPQESLGRRFFKLLHRPSLAQDSNELLGAQLAPTVEGGARSDHIESCSHKDLGQRCAHFPVPPSCRCPRRREPRPVHEARNPGWNRTDVRSQGHPAGRLLPLIEAINPSSGGIEMSLGLESLSARAPLQALLRLNRGRCQSSLAQFGFQLSNPGLQQNHLRLESFAPLSFGGRLEFRGAQTRGQHRANAVVPDNAAATHGGGPPDRHRSPDRLLTLERQSRPGVGAMATTWLEVGSPRLVPVCRCASCAMKVCQPNHSKPKPSRP